MAFNAVEGVVGKNLFNKATAISEKYVDYITGELVTNASFYASDYIKVLPNTKYVKTSDKQLAFYDSNKSFISGLGNGYITFTTPENAKYIRITIPLNNINIEQLEKGDIATEYEEYRIMTNPLTISDSSISKNKLDFKIIEPEPNVNLFDKTKVTTGRYIDYKTGIIALNSSYSASDYIKVSPNTTYIKSNAEQFAFYDTNKTFIKGLLNDRSFTTPENCYYVRFTIPNSQVDYFQFQKGSVLTTYEEYGVKYNLKNIKNPQNIIIVAKSGGDYTTITEAVARANDSSTNPVTILIMPGVYEESVYIGGSRNISLVGINKKTCIITDKSGLRENAPLEISGEVYVSNLTIYATYTDENVVINNLGSYAVHCDYVGQGTIEFFNCDIISDCSSAIGCGTFSNQTIIFNKCLLKSTNKTNYMSSWCYTVFLHGNTTSGTLNQSYILKDCEIHGVQDRVIRLANVGSEFNVTFINNMIWSDTNKKDDSIIYFDGVVEINEKSFGNNVTILNK